jgi:hypothetical protein
MVRWCFVGRGFSRDIKSADYSERGGTLPFGHSRTNFARVNQLPSLSPSRPKISSLAG